MVVRVLSCKSFLVGAKGWGCRVCSLLVRGRVSQRKAEPDRRWKEKSTEHATLVRTSAPNTLTAAKRYSGRIHSCEWGTGGGVRWCVVSFCVATSSWVECWGSSSFVKQPHHHTPGSHKQMQAWKATIWHNWGNLPLFGEISWDEEYWWEIKKFSKTFIQNQKRQKCVFFVFMKSRYLFGVISLDLRSLSGKNGGV